MNTDPVFPEVNTVVGYSGWGALKKHNELFITAPYSLIQKFLYEKWNIPYSPAGGKFMEGKYIYPQMDYAYNTEEISKNVFKKNKAMDQIWF